jgi:hypothetical protein
MSLLDEVRKLEHQVVSRLKELEPLTREYNQLRQLAQRLGLRYSAPSEAAPEDAPASSPATGRRTAANKRTATRAATKPRAAKRATAKPEKPRTAARRTARSAPADAAPPAGKPSARARRSGASKRTATRPGQRADDVLRVVSANPGITVRQIGEQLGVDPTGLYRVANKLAQDGRVRKDGTGLYAVESGEAAPPDATVEPAAPAATDGAAAAGGEDAGGAPSAGTGTAGSA